MWGKPQVLGATWARGRPQAPATLPPPHWLYSFSLWCRARSFAAGEEDTEEEEANKFKFDLMTLDPIKDDPEDSDDRGEGSESSLVLWRDSPRNSMDLFNAPPSCIGFQFKHAYIFLELSNYVIYGRRNHLIGTPLAGSNLNT